MSNRRFVVRATRTSRMLVLYVKLNSHDPMKWRWGTAVDATALSLVDAMLMIEQINTRFNTHPHYRPQLELIEVET